MKKPPAVVIILLAVSQLASPATSRGCSVRVSLWDTIAEADAIVVARIERIETDTSPGNPTLAQPSPDRQTAVLRILESWKGSLSGEITVHFDWGVPSGYAVGEIVVEFLERGESRARRWHDSEIEVLANIAGLLREAEETGAEAETWTAEDQAESWERLERFAAWSVGRWLPIGISPDLRHADEETRDIVQSLVEKAVRLQATDSSDGDKIEWFVGAAEHLATREYGLYDLELENLTKDQLSRLARAFLSEPAVGPTDLYFLKLFEGYSSLDVDRAAAAVVEAGFLINPIPSWVTAMVEESLKRYGDNFADRIGRDDRDSRGRLIYTGKGENTLPTIWEVARRDLGIPSVLPAEAPKRPDDATENQSRE